MYGNMLKNYLSQLKIILENILRICGNMYGNMLKNCLSQLKISLKKHIEHESTSL